MMIRYFLIGVFLLYCTNAIDAQAPIDTLTVGYSNAAPFIINDEGSKLIGVNVWLWEQIAKDPSVVIKDKK